MTLPVEYDLAWLGLGDIYNAAEAVGDTEIQAAVLEAQRIIDSRKYAHVAVRDWTQAEMVDLILLRADVHGIPRELPLGCAIAESGIRQYAERWGYRTAWGAAAVKTPQLDDDQAVLDAMAADGTPLDCSFGPGQQIVRFAPVGNQTMTPENVLVVRAWLFDPNNAIPLMTQKLADSYHDRRGRGFGQHEAIMQALYRYNTGGWAPPSGQFAGNVGNYTRALDRARQMLAA